MIIPRDRDWTGIIFRPRITVEPDGIRFTRWQVIRTEELFIPFSRIASFYVRRGLVFTDIEIHTIGQNTPLTTRLLKADASALQGAVESRLP